jgi:diadenosine tetraphosphatase ApaH/serine/threonine PP2A family protein phosphatase
MKVGIFSDVHGNLEALSAVLGLLKGKGAGSFVCCGDIVGYGPDPHACVRRVAALRGPVVAGNHDYGVLGRVALASFNAAARAALAWTAKQLTEDDDAYLDSLPLTQQLGSLYLVHSSPSAPEHWDYIFAVREAEEEMGYFSSIGCVIGHSHYPFVVERRSGEPARLLSGNSIKLRPDAKYLINVGSVGQPRDGDPRACCVLFDTETRVISFSRVEYEIPVVQAKILRAGLPEFLASRLSLGR